MFARASFVELLAQREQDAEKIGVPGRIRGRTRGQDRVWRNQMLRMPNQKH
jgi:hypothetical protein